MRGSSSSAAVLLLAALHGACQPDRAEPVRGKVSEPSPNASILPAPLASDLPAPRDPSDAGASPRDAGSDSGVEPAEPALEDRPLPGDPEERDLGGLNLEARFRWLDVALPSRLPEANPEAVERARQTTAFELAVDLAATGRLRVSITSHTLPLPKGTEILGRTDILGHALSWPDGETYTVVPPGGLRPTLNERRPDVIQLARARAVPGASGNALGLPVERRQLLTSHGRTELDQARLAGSGLGGPLLCRLLIELAGVSPDNPVCATELVPLRAEFIWAEGGRAMFEVTKLTRVTSLPAETLQVPPRRASFRRSELPPPDPPLLLSANELGRFRLRALPKERRETTAVKEGLLVVNRGELSTYLLVDGVPIFRAAPRSEDVTIPLVPGTYSVASRDFLGSANVAPSMISAPARVVLSEVAREEP